MKSPDDTDRIVCFCHNVHYSELVAAIRAGADTHAKIQAETCASTGCGGCEWEVLQILEDLKEELQAAAQNTQSSASDADGSSGESSDNRNASISKAK